MKINTVQFYACVGVLKVLQDLEAQRERVRKAAELVIGEELYEKLGDLPYEVGSEDEDLAERVRKILEGKGVEIEK